MSDKKLKVLSVEEMLAVEDTTYSTVRWGNGVIRLGSLSIGAMLDHYEKNKDKNAQKTAGLRMVIESLVDDQGNRIGSMSMIDALRKKDAAAISRVVDEINRLNGFGDNPLNYTEQIRRTANDDGSYDMEKLKPIIAEMRGAADALERSSGQKKSVEDVLTGKAKDEAKNGSSETNSGVSPSV